MTVYPSDPVGTIEPPPAYKSESLRGCSLQWLWKAGEVIAIGAVRPSGHGRGRLRKVRAPQWPGLLGNAQCG